MAHLPALNLSCNGLALSVAHGIDWNERPTMQGAVLYLAMEGQSLVQGPMCIEKQSI